MKIKNQLFTFKIDVILKIPGLESLFKEVAGHQSCNFIKKRLQNMFFCENCKIFKNTFFYRTPLIAAFLDEQQQQSVQRRVSHISCAQQISDLLQFSQ